MNLNARRALACAIGLLVLAPASAGAKTLVGTPGQDRLVGPVFGDHTMNGDGGGDVLIGGNGHDRMLGETGGDELWGRDGDDHLEGGSGAEDADGEGGNDRVLGGYGGDDVKGGAGDDYVNGDAAGDEVDGGPGNDEVHGGSATDVVRGGDGNDRVYSDSGYDALDAGPGDDLVFVNNGTAVGTVQCGPGHDTLYINPYRMSGGISNAQAIREGRVKECEQIVEEPMPVDPAFGVKRLVDVSGGRGEGTQRNDTLLGATGADILIGYGGDDVVWANRLPEGPSNGVDRVAAGEGNDTVYGARNGRTIMDGGPGDDYLQGGILTSRNTIIGGDGADTVRLTGDGRNVVRAGSGDDLVYAYSKGSLTLVDCGPGDDAVKIGYNRAVKVRGNCENVRRRYLGQD